MAKKTKKVAAKKPVKKSVKKPAAKKIAAKKPVKKVAAKKPAAKTVSNKKTINKKPVAQKNSKVIKASPSVKKPEAKQIKSNVISMKPKAITKKPLAKKVELPSGYKPTQKEEYMNQLQLEYFKRKLSEWKRELLSESTETLEHLRAETWNEPDPSDQATIVEQTGLELRTRDRYRKLISKIDSALSRIEAGEYGYCEVTGDPIGLARLEARPIATMTIAAQEQHEMEERLNMEG
jgi:DnaK suppressor protein